MKILIIEDEALAADQLAFMLQRYRADIEIMAKLDSVSESIAWLKSHAPPDLMFLDIQLSDGLSFEIFEQIRPACPVIFTTAYDEYALQAFKANGIAYILKPIDQEEIMQAFEQYDRLQAAFGTEKAGINLTGIQEALVRLEKKYKKRFLVNTGLRLLPISVEEIAYFFSEHKNVWLKQLNGKRYGVDFNLEELENLLDPKQFFRINRQYIVSMVGIKEILQYSNQRLRLLLFDVPPQEIITISREKVPSFKQWLVQ